MRDLEIIFTLLAPSAPPFLMSDSSEDPTIIELNFVCGFTLKPSDLEVLPIVPSLFTLAACAFVNKKIVQGESFFVVEWPDIGRKLSKLIHGAINERLVRCEASKHVHYFPLERFTRRIVMFVLPALLTSATGSATLSKILNMPYYVRQLPVYMNAVLMNGGKLYCCRSCEIEVYNAIYFAGLEQIHNEHQRLKEICDEFWDWKMLPIKENLPPEARVDASKRRRQEPSPEL